MMISREIHFTGSPTFRIHISSTVTVAEFVETIEINKFRILGRSLDNLFQIAANFLIYDLFNNFDKRVGLNLLIPLVS